MSSESKLHRMTLSQFAERLNIPNYEAMSILNFLVQNKFAKVVDKIASEKSHRPVALYEIPETIRFDASVDHSD